jgi:hypothetical protein
MADESSGGCHSGFTRGYCPHFIAAGQTDMLSVRALTPVVTSPTSPPFLAEFSLMYWPAVDCSALSEGSIFAVQEGPRAVGSGRVIRHLPSHEHPELYCPRCGELLVRSDSGELQCRRGQMGLSEDMEERLIAKYIERTRTAVRSVFTYGDRPQAAGGIWHCPGCSSAVTESSPGVLMCLGCGQSVVNFVYHLVELHPRL